MRSPPPIPSEGERSPHISEKRSPLPIPSKGERSTLPFSVVIAPTHPISRRAIAPPVPNCAPTHPIRRRAIAPSFAVAIAPLIYSSTHVLIYTGRTIPHPTSYREIITIEPDKRGGNPCIRRMRITVYDVLGWLAVGMTHEEILDDFLELTEQDIRACLEFTSDIETEIKCSQGNCYSS